MNSNPIANRRYSSDSGKTVVAAIFSPRQRTSEQWTCRFRIDGLVQAVDEDAYGVDSMQALQMALEGVRVRLRDCGEVMTFLEGEPGDLGIARPIPLGYGLELYERLERLVDDEVTRAVREPR